MIYKITGKSLKKNRKLLISMAIMYVLANFLIIFSSTIGDHYKRNFTDYMKAANVEEFKLQTDLRLEYQAHMLGQASPMSVERLHEIEQKYDVVLEMQQQGTYYYEKNDVSASIELTSYTDDTKMNQLTVLQGRLPINENEIFLNDKYVEANGYQINDKITIFDREVTIVGYGFIPTYIYPISFQALYPNPERFGNGYLNSTTFEELVDSGQLIAGTTLSGQFNQELTRNERYALVNKIVEQEKVEITTYDQYFQPTSQTESLFTFGSTREFNMRISTFASEVGNNAMFLSTMGKTIALISVFLTVLLFNSILKSQRREMGILKAEGVQTLKIAFSFLGHFIVMLVPSIILGGIIAKLTTPLLQGMYEQYFSLPITDVKFADMAVALPEVAIIFVAVVIFVFVFSIYNNLKTPTLLLIKNIDKSQIPKFNFTKIFHRAPFTLKYRLNLLFRNWTKTLFLIFAVMISSFLLLLAALGLSGINGIFKVFDTMYHYDFEAYYSTVLKAQEGEDTSNFGFIQRADLEYVALSSTQKTTKQNDKITTDIENNEQPTINLFGFYPDRNQLITLTDASGKLIPAEDFDNGIVITQLISELYQVNVGDSITVSFTNNQNEKVLKTLTVTNKVDNFIYPFAYTRIDNVRELTGAGANSYNQQVGLVKDRSAVYAKDPNVMYVSTKEMVSQLKQRTEFIYIIMGVVAVVAGVISLVTLTSISSVIVNSNRKTISIMKVMGYHNKEIKKMTIATYKWICILVYFATIPFILWLINTLVRMALKNQDFSLPLRLNAEFLIIGFVIIFGVYLISSSLVFRSIKNINMSESLKSDE